MGYKIILMAIICLMLLFPISVSSESNYVNVEYYYNDHLVTNSDSPVTPKPLLKIGEPFKLRFKVTCYKKNYLSTKLLSIGNNDFDILEGPTSNLGTGTRETIAANETRVFEWTVVPNEEWAGGSAPIDFYYQLTDLDTAETITNGRFTAAYVTISDEYYDGPETTKSSDSQSNASSSNSAPGFTMLVALMAVIAVFVVRIKDW